MASSYNDEQRKMRLFSAIKMRDAKVERLNRKTGQVEILSYSRTYIQKVNNLRRFEAIHLGIFPRPKKAMEQLQSQVSRALSKAKAKGTVKGLA